MEVRLDTKEVRPLSQSPSSDGGRLSPDGLWLAYHSNRSGRPEIYVQPYPEVNAGRWQVSVAGGRWPLWARDGRELFFLAPDGSLMGSRVRAAGTSWSTGPPVKLLEPGYWSLGRLPGRNFDVSPDGKRFLVVTAPKDASPPELIVVQHWDQELRARVPPK
jgi:Tol biopolymer transport system component